MKLKATSKKILCEGLFEFKDLNGNGKLDRYEDYRLSAVERAKDLCSKMNLAEKAGMMLIDTLNADWNGDIPEKAYKFIRKENMRHFVFRNGITNFPEKLQNRKEGSLIGEPITAYNAACFTNKIQQIAEETRLGIPVLFKSNPRCHVEEDARYGINVASGSFSSWPKEAGLAATRDFSLIQDFAYTVKDEFKAVGIRGIYGYMADLATEARWNRTHETFTDNADLCANIITTLVQTFQGSKVSNDSVAMTVKHFFGGGPQKDGLDPHYPYGKEQIYPTDNLSYHLIPFQAAIDANVASIMPYYGIPVKMHEFYPVADDIVFDKEIGIGMAFNKGIITDLLKRKMGFKGYVNSDTGIIGTRQWGIEKYSPSQALAISINAGTDILSGFNTCEPVLSIIGKEFIADEGNLFLPRGVSEGRIDEAVIQILTELFALGLFENPYTDESRADRIVGCDVFAKKAFSAQKKSIVILQGKEFLPLDKAATYYVAGINKMSALKCNLKVVDTIEQASKCIIHLKVKNSIEPVFESDGAQMVFPNGKMVDTQFGGPLPEETDFLSLSRMEMSKSWHLTPSLLEIQDIIGKIGKENTYIAIAFRQAYVLDKQAKIRDVACLLATFGVSDDALLDMLCSSRTNQGKLPYALAENLEAIITHPSDQPGYEGKDTLYQYGYGL